MTIRLLPQNRLDRILPLLEQVQALHCAAQPHRYRPFSDRAEVLGWLETWVTAQQVRILISGPVEVPTGYLAYTVTAKPPSLIRPAQSIATLEHICVDAARRGKGVGRALIAELRRQLRATNVTHIRATYSAWNDASAALFKSEGFAVSSIDVEAAID